MKKKDIKAIRGLILFAAVLILAVTNFDKVTALFTIGLNVITPFLIGSIVAFVVNLPMKFVEQKILFKLKKEKLKRILSFLIALLFIGSIVWLIYLLILPQLSKTIADLTIEIPIFIKETILALQEVFENNEHVQEYIKSLDILNWDWNDIVTKIANATYSGISSIVVSTVNVASSFFETLLDFVIAIVFAIYLLLEKEKHKNRVDRVFAAYLPEKVHKKILYIFSLLYQNFSRFISSQCLDAAILGLMFMIVMSIFRFPYAVLIGTLITVTALVPIVGAFTGCIIGTFLVLIDSPNMALCFVVMFLIIQQIEGNFIYPRIVGTSVGLSPIYVLVAVSVSGSLFGIVGMLTCIPVVSTLYTLLKEDVTKKESNTIIGS